MIDYQQGKIYIIVNTANNFIYVGSTTQTMSRRMTGHRVNATKGCSDIYTAFRLIGVANFRIILHHAFPCNSKDELEAEEYKTLQTFIDNGTPTYNMKVAGNKLKPALQQQQGGFIVYREDRGRKTWYFRYQIDGVGYSKGFSTNRYGFWQAKLMAENARKQQFPGWRTDEEIAMDEFAGICID